MLALSIRQPYAELILRGRKRIEHRTTTAAKLVGRRFYIYASRKTLPDFGELSRGVEDRFGKLTAGRTRPTRGS